MTDVTPTAEPCSCKSDMCIAEQKSQSKWLGELKGAQESLTHAEESSNVLGKMMTIFNTDLQHDKFMSWFSISMLMYFMLLLPFFCGAVVLRKGLSPQASSCWCVPSGLRLWHCHPSSAHHRQPQSRKEGC